MENSHGLLRLNIRLECNFLTRWIRITECLPFFIFGVLGGIRGLGSWGGRCSDSTSSAGRVGPVAAQTAGQPHGSLKDRVISSAKIVSVQTSK